MKKNVLAYILTIVVFGWGIYAIIQAGKRLELAPAVAKAVGTDTTASSNQVSPPPETKSETGPAHLLQVLRDNLRDPLSRLLVQLIVIVVFARAFGMLFMKMRQPAVIGEMLAGIVLGPSLIGTLFPGGFHFIFPSESLGALRMLSQVGIIMFMFVVGMELDVKQLGQKAGPAVVVSHVSIIFPYFLGVLFSYFIYKNFASAHVPFLPFALFMGIAMSITAFPVLARILEDRNLTKTFLGSTAITCAAVDDLTAWSILAFVVAIVKAGGLATSVLTIALALAFIALVLFVLKPWFNRLLLARPKLAAEPTRGVVVMVLIMVFSSALFTEVIGIHALFGAFLTGIAMPKDSHFRSVLQERLESFSSAFLLPLFFAFTGLRTQVGLLNGWEDWLVCLGLILTATLGKLGGSMVTARWTGMSWRESFALGALMNTRGLVELIVLNIGLDLGILSPQVFAMMVIMALVTTFMTGPLLSLSQRSREENSALAVQRSGA